MMGPSLLKEVTYSTAEFAEENWFELLVNLANSLRLFQMGGHDLQDVSGRSLVARLCQAGYS